MRGKSHVPFCRAVSGVTRLLTLMICQRIDKAYKLFFKHHKRGVRPPSFKKVKKYRSFTLKQAGYKLLGDNRIKLGNKVYSFWKSREIEGKVKTVTVKRSSLGELFLAIVVEDHKRTRCRRFPPAREPSVKYINKTATGKTAGFDFGFKTFLKVSNGEDIKAPEFLKQSLNELAKANRNLSRKKQGSNNWHKARLNLVRKHEQIVNRRRNWFWELAHKLTNQYDVLCFETLNLKGMQRLWGRKVSDLSFATFLEILQWVATKKGKQVVFIDPWYPSSKTCNHCGTAKDKLPLDVRRWRCVCGAENDRDLNAAQIIHRVGTSTLALGDVSQFSTALSA